MPVGDELPRLASCCRKPHPIDKVVEPRLQQEQEVFAVLALHLSGLDEEFFELLFRHAVEMADFLFLLQLHSVFGKLSAALPVLARSIGAFFSSFPFSRMEHLSLLDIFQTGPV